MSSTQPPKPQHKYACALCARRKVKCDRVQPCSNCTKTQSQCLFENPAPPRPRKRAADEDLLARLSQYEDLMRKHNVDFTPYAHTWVPYKSVSAVKEDKSCGSSPLPPTPSSILPQTDPSPLRDDSRVLERCLWSELSPELKFPPLQTLEHEDDILVNPLPSLGKLLQNDQPNLRDLHPEPRHIYRFWQRFVESVNPLTKLVHIPTLQERVLEAAWNPSGATRSLTAILFVVYALAVASLSTDECEASFGETRDVLLTRYRGAAFRALMEADFLTTRDFEVLQAFVLFLFIDPDSDLTSTLTGAAVRIGQKMGLRREKRDPSVSVFESELRVRLWWQLNGIEARVRSTATPGLKLPPSQSEFGDIRPPLNVNDADLHPDMTELPAEHKGPTDMFVVLMKFEIYHWYRTSSIASQFFDVLSQPGAKGPTMTLSDEAIDEIESIYEEKYLRHLDQNIPLHKLTYAMGKVSVARMRFKVHHPLGTPTASDGAVYRTPEDNRLRFESAVLWLEMIDVGMRSPFSSVIFGHFTAKFTLPAYIYIISELRRLTSGERVSVAWTLVEDLYKTHPRLLEDTENKFFVALNELTLEAWEARRAELLRAPSNKRTNALPRFIQMIYENQQGKNEALVHGPGPENMQPVDTFGLMADGSLDWDYWHEFLRI